MKNKKILSLAASIMLAATVAVPSFAAVPKDPNLDNVNVKVWKNIQAGEEYTGMGAHANKCFEEGIGLVPNTDKLRKTYTKKLKVFFITGYIDSLTLNGVSGVRGSGEDYRFTFPDINAQQISNTGRKYFGGEAVIHVMGNKTKHIDLEIQR